MKKEIWIVIVICCLFLALMGTTVFVYQTLLSAVEIPVISVYHYESSDRGWAEIEVPAKGRTLEMVEESFKSYKEWKGDDNLQLFITSKPDPDQDDITHRRWTYPYMDPSENPKNNYYFEMTPESNVSN